MTRHAGLGVDGAKTPNRRLARAAGMGEWVCSVGVRPRARQKEPSPLSCEEQDFIDAVTHEMVHAFGAGDAYAEASKNMPGASKPYPKRGIARVALSSQRSTGVGDIDIQMMMEAQITGQYQSYQTYSYNGFNFVTSPAMK